MKLFIHPINRLRDFTYQRIPPLFNLLSYLRRKVYSAQNVFIRLKNLLGNEPPLPSSKLMYLVAGTNDLGWFLTSGKFGALCLRDILTKNGIEIVKLDSILDFGCGSGRVLRYWQALTATKVYGCDYNPELITWCQKNLQFAQFIVNPILGKLDYSDNQFDLIYALSVFTHLTESSQKYWIRELTRVVKPGGYLFITLNGDYYLSSLAVKQQTEYKSGKIVVVHADEEGKNNCAAYHPKSYVLSHFAGELVLIDHVPEGAAGNPRQDVYLFQKPG